jgi:hypothetical protein
MDDLSVDGRGLSAVDVTRVDDAADPASLIGHADKQK